MDKEFSERIKKQIAIQRPLGFIVLLNEDKVRIEFDCIFEYSTGVIGEYTVEAEFERPRQIDLYRGNFIKVVNHIEDLNNIEVIRFYKTENK